jgi:hypothetical protein
VSVQRYTSLITKFLDLESRLAELQSKASLSDEEYDEYNSIMRSPFRILMSDIDRAEGVSDLVDWERFNEMASKASDIQALKMRAKFKEFFAERDQTAGATNIQINLGGDFIKDL